MGKFKRPVKVVITDPRFEANVHVTVMDSVTKLAINDAEVKVRIDNDLGVFTGSLSNPNGYYKITIPKEVPKPYGGDIIVIREGYKTKATRVTIAHPDMDINGGIELVSLAPIIPRENGRITVSNSFFVRENKVWFMKSVTLFMLFARYCNGEDVTKAFIWLRKNGFNTARVLGPVDWPGWDSYRKITNWDLLHQFFALADTYNVRVLWVPITTRVNEADHIGLVRNSIALANSFDNVLVQVCNEPLKDGKCDPVDLYRKCGIVSNTLLDYGLYETDNWPDDRPYANFGSIHLDRSYPKFARKSKDLLELRDKYRIPFIHDEPIGVAEADFPGRRTTDIDGIVDDCAVAMLSGNGWDYHFELGIQGLIPDDNSIQGRCAIRLSELFRFLPDSVVQGSYSAPHIENFPAVWSEADSKVQHAYAKISGNEAYLVNIMPTRVIEAKAPWRVASKFSDSIMKLVK